MTNPARRAALQQYMECCRDLLRLSAWDIEVHEDPADDTSALEVVTTPKRHYAKIMIGASFFDPARPEESSPDAQRQAVLHELIHLEQGVLFDWLDEGILDEWLPKATAHLIRTLIKDECEKVCDWTARAFSGSLPLPPEWPDA